MEDRKRPALSSSDDLAPPSKRHQVNGGNKVKDDPDSKEEDFIKEFQKDAIWRQMQDYKRQYAYYKDRVDEVEKKAADHDEHLRIVDAWWLQLIDEVSLLAEGSVPLEALEADQKSASFRTRVSFRDCEDLQSHLRVLSDDIKTKLDSLFSRLAAARGKVDPKVSELESQITSLLETKRGALVQLEGLGAKHSEQEVKYNDALMRYMRAEKRIERNKSALVTKLEQQALANAVARPPAQTDAENGTAAKENPAINEATQVALQEANAVIETQKEQLEAALARSKTLQEELTTVQTRMASLGDEDYARTDVFKQFKKEHERLIERINHLEAENKKLKADLSALEKDRDGYRKQLETEAQTLTSELEDQLQQVDTNLARVRSARDELHGQVTMLTASKEQDRSASESLRELINAKEERIIALESQVQRLEPTEDVEMDGQHAVDELPLEQLRERYKKLQRDFDSINKELPAMTMAVKKFQALATKKVADISGLEERIQMAIASKEKADQKYFGARKSSDTKDDEIRKLRTQNGKSSEIISQLKDVEAQNRSVMASLEKQVAQLKQTNAKTITENKKVEAASNDALRKYEALKTQITELTNLARTKDSTTSMARERAVTLEADVEKLKVRLESAAKDRDNWKKKSMSNSSEEEDMLRKLATCAVCRSNFKDTALKTCGHLFCKSCIDDRISNRMRKCPGCNKAFDRMDLMSVHL